MEGISKYWLFTSKSDEIIYFEHPGVQYCIMANVKTDDWYKEGLVRMKQACDIATMQSHCPLAYKCIEEQYVAEIVNYFKSMDDWYEYGEMDVVAIVDTSKKPVVYDHDNLKYIYQKIFTVQESNQYMKRLLDEIEFIPADKAVVKVFDKWHKVPRKLAAYGEPGIFYKFNNLSVDAKPWTPTLKEIKKVVEEISNYTFNFALINYYEDGKHYISPHQDNEKELVRESPICGVSFGYPRIFRFTRKDRPTHRRLLEHGSLIIMQYPTNQYWHHGINKCANASARLSITFRNVIV